MDGRICRSAVQFYPQERKSWFHNDKEDRPSRVAFVVQLLTAVWLLTLLVSNPINMVAQTPEGDDSGRGSIVSPAGTAMPNQSSYAVSVAQLSVPAKAARHLEKAQKRFKSDLAGAIREIDQALEICPDYAQAFSLRAFAKLALKDFAGAIEDAHRAMALDPHDPAPILALATACNSAKEFSKAAEAALQALSLDPNAWQGQLELAKSWYGQGQYSLALKALDRIHIDFPDVHLVRANVLMREGHSAEATEQFRLFLIEAPDDPRDGQISRILSDTGGQTGAPTPKP